MAALGAMAAPTQPPRPLRAAADSAFQVHRAEIANPRYLTIIDYSRSVLRERLWLVDRATGRVLVHAHVSHAFDSGFLRPVRFSDVRGSNESSVGSFRTDTAYNGQYGEAVRLVGLDPGLNGTALARRVVFHRSPQRIPVWSHGCFTTWPSTNAQLLPRIAGGTFVYVGRSAGPGSPLPRVDSARPAPAAAGAARSPAARVSWPRPGR